MALYKFKGEHFLRMIYRDKNGTYLTHLYFIGSKEKAQHFEYSVQVEDARYKNKITFESSNIPLMDTCSSEIRCNQLGLLLIENMVKRCTDNNNLTFSYKLKKISNMDAHVEDFEKIEEIEEINDVIKFVFTKSYLKKGL